MSEDPDFKRREVQIEKSRVELAALRKRIEKFVETERAARAKKPFGHLLAGVSSTVFRLEKVVAAIPLPPVGL